MAGWSWWNSIWRRWPGVRACADALTSKGEPFDLVIANAGVMACPKGQTADGFETQFRTNHLGHFVLVNRVVSLLKPGSRLVNLSSAGHRFSDVDLDDPNFEHTPYTEFGAYGRSKTANILYAVEFERRHKPNGVRATAVHPGGIQTELGRHLSPEAIKEPRCRYGSMLRSRVGRALWLDLGFQQFGLPTVLAGIAFAYSGSVSSS